jgi:hypothetical protein
MAQERLTFHAGPKNPIAPIEKQTEYIEAGPVTFGIEYRLLGKAAEAVRDQGVTIHVFDSRDGKRTERIRFDCFDTDPHIHYIDPAKSVNDLNGIDPVADGDPAAFALDCIQTRLADMLRAAGAGDLAKQIDPAALDDAMPRVAEAAYRARFHTDAEAMHRGAGK